MENLTPLIDAIIKAIAVLVGLFFSALFYNSEKRSTIIYWLEVAVSAAEEKFKETGQGALKYKFVKDFLKKKGFTWDEEETSMLIKGMVWQIINAWKQEE